MKTVSRATPISKSSTPASSPPPAAAPAESPRLPSRPLVSGRSGFRLLLLALLLVSGAAGNLLRVLTWTQASGFIAAPFGSTSLVAARPAAQIVERYAKIDLPAPAWRPIRVDFQARAARAAVSDPASDPARGAESAAAGGSGRGQVVGGGASVAAGAVAGASEEAEAAGGETMLEATVDNADLPAQTIGAAWQAVSLRAVRAPVADGLVTLRLSTMRAGTRESGGRVELADMRVTPLFAVAPLLRHGGVGALFGLVVWALLVWRGPTQAGAASGISAEAMPSTAGGIGVGVGDGAGDGVVDRVGVGLPVRVGVGDSASAEARPLPARRPVSAREALAAGLAIFALLTTWALIRPPLQSPDEPHQFLRVTSILGGPWIGGASTLTIDPRFFNPLTWGAPRLAAITFDAQRPLTHEDLVALKATPWPATSPSAPATTIYVAITSYPPLYYWGVFALGQPIASMARLTPYQAFYLFRLASVLLVTLAWTAVYLLLRRTPDTSRYAEPILALLLLNPMLAFMSSAVTADALSFPLLTLTVVACWRTLTTGAGLWTMVAGALLALATKPSGGQMVGAVTMAMAWGVWRGWTPASRAWVLLRALWLSAAIAYAGFYAWSPTQFTFEPGHATITLIAYATHVARSVPDVWISFWGHLGWLEYRLAWPWYAALLGLVCVCAWLRARQLRRAASPFDEFLLVYALAFIGSTIVGGFLNLAVAGYMLQGRYFLPVAIALGPLVMLARRWQRWLLPAGIGLVHVLLLWATIARYFQGDLGLLWASMPFV